MKNQRHKKYYKLKYNFEGKNIYNSVFLLYINYNYIITASSILKLTNLKSKNYNLHIYI